MVNLISFDDVTVSFSREEAREIPYIVDAFGDESLLDTEEELPALFASGKQLLLLKQAHVNKIANKPVSFIPKFESIRFGNEYLRPPPFMKLVWKSYLTSFFELLSPEDLLELLIVADSMAAWELRQGVIYTIIHRIVTGKHAFHEFFASDDERLIQVVKVVYIHGLSNDKNNDYCDPQDSSLIL
jgi:hypothetical protein